MNAFESFLTWLFSLFTPAAILALLLSLLGLGCAANERDAQIATFKEVTIFAKELGVSGTANFNIDGDPSFDMRTGGVLHTGLSANVNLQFNALAEPRGAATTGVGSTIGTVKPMDDTTTE